MILNSKIPKKHKIVAVENLQNIKAIIGSLMSWFVLIGLIS